MLISVALILLVGIFVGKLFEKVALPGLLGMILGGVLIGPYGLDLISGSVLDISGEIRQVALVIILLRAGLALSTEDLKRIGRPAVLMCFVPACFEIGGMMLLAPRILGISLLDAAIMGSVVAAVSPAVIVPRMLRLMEEGYGVDKGIPQLILAGASVDDVFVIVLFSSFTGLAGGEGLSIGHFLRIPAAILMGILGGIVVGMFLKILLELMGRREKVNGIEQALIVLCAAFLLTAGEGWISRWIPFSGLLAVMAAGITLLKGMPRMSFEISRKLTALWSIAQIFLFVLVGAAVDIHYAISAGIGAAVLLVFVLLFRMIGVLLCVSGTALNMKERLFCMIAYVPKATVQASIGAIPLSLGLACGPMVLTVAVLSILVTAPIGAICIDKLSPKWLGQKKTPH